MKYKFAVKTFSRFRHYDLEADINQFLNEIEGIIIQSIHYSTTIQIPNDQYTENHQVYSALIYYSFQVKLEKHER